MKTISILASGPPKPGRNRHLEIFNNIPCITHVINNCKVDNVKISVIISNKNIELKEYIQKNHNDVNIIETKDDSMKTTYEMAFYQDENDSLIVAGDLWNLRKDNIIKFLNSEYESALYRLKYPWGDDIYSIYDNLIRRGDIGDSLVLISNKHKKTYLSDHNINLAVSYFEKFYPQSDFNINLGNHLWTWLDYVFFFDISSSKDHSVNNIDNKGSIYIDDLVYLDND